MKPIIPQIVVPLSISLGLQLFISHAAAAVVAVLLHGSGTLFAVTIALLVGLALVYPLQRSIRIIASLLDAPQSPISLRGHGSLMPLVKRLKDVAGQLHEVTVMRQEMLDRVQEATAQQERNRLARDLHDTLKQQIFSIQMSTAAAQTRWLDDPLGAQTALGDVRQLAQDAMRELNALLQQLSPAPLETVGLIQALRDQCEAFGYRAGFQAVTEFGLLPDEDRLPTGTQESLFRLTQEALSNVVRHARARHVHLYLGLSTTGHDLMLVIRDDGQGFDTLAVTSGMGLHNVRQRVSELGGTFMIESAEGAGTTLQVTIPLLQTQLVQEEMMTLNLNHPVHKTCLVGLMGGIVLIALLYYPLYVLLPGAYLNDWQQGSSVVGIVCQAAAALTAVGIGHLAARWALVSTRRGATIMGACAGGIASLVLYAGLTNTAAGVIGSATLVRYGALPALNEQHFMQLVFDPVVGIIWSTYSLLWLQCFLGVGLGALGGLLSPPDHQSAVGRDMRELLRVPLLCMAVVSALSLLGTGLIFQLLEDSLQRVAVDYGFRVSSSLLNGISAWPIMTAMAVYLAVLNALYRLLLAGSREAPTGMFWSRPFGNFMLFLVIAACPLLVLRLYQWPSMSNNASLQAVLYGGAIIAVARALQITRLANDIRAQLVAKGLLLPLTPMKRCILFAYVSSFVLLLLNSPTGAGLVLIVALIADRLTPASPKLDDYSVLVTAFRFHLNGIFVTITGISLSMMSVVPVLPLTLIITPAIASLASYDPAFVAAESASMRELLQGAYAVHLQVLLLSFLFSAAVVGLVTLIMWTVLRFEGRRQVLRS